jgi:hypothetical protein
LRANLILKKMDETDSPKKGNKNWREIKSIEKSFI